jgi:hypothetical protein
MKGRVKGAVVGGWSASVDEGKSYFRRSSMCMWNGDC